MEMVDAGFSRIDTSGANLFVMCICKFVYIGAQNTHGFLLYFLNSHDT